ncbi:MULTISPECIES: hypothetical protein [Microbacterium]|uniref:Protoporphyrinogen oxidase n=1 Tax=Microbacterium testaceum TaxID=2033 RepID=A0A147F493_MICTE|nr:MULTISPECIES: hypothetical protein [Microbacterium]KTS04609.1 hypothetical protein NS283_09070 [Microbacterium testaceum]KTS08752.1 hypothetical protein RSA3_15015 [Microbacterium testaceum]KTS85161.1 hypothetical protein NS183_13290 [Microbacterium testaceum]MDF2044597.1 hypothetical protein [Microbacterium sp. Kw_RZR3]MDQ1075315.1 hypothetical protein [Microbacterium sp. SORGH_AS_0969]
MRGKAALVVGLVAGYVLGARAGRERYEQIKAQAEKVWEQPVVQGQVEKVKAFGVSALKSVPGVVWKGAKSVTGAAAQSGTAQERAERAAKAAKQSASEVADVVEDSVDDAKQAEKTATTRARAAKSGSTSSGS